MRNKESLNTAFFAQSRADMGQKLQSLNCSLIHASSIYQHIYKKMQDNLLSTPWLPHKAAEALAQLGCDSLITENQVTSDHDESVKFVFRLRDGHTIETVLMPESKRTTICVSSQVGCRQACSFCHTGRMGLARNLTSDEIVAQIVSASRWMKAQTNWPQKKLGSRNKNVTNVVFMGMGEPLDNVQEVSKALTIISDPLGLNIPMRRISVSTAGHIDGAKELLSLQPQTNFALSVHTPFEQERSQLMPINKRYKLQDVIRFFREHLLPEQTLFVQYTLIEGVNNSTEHAVALAKLLEGMNVKVNVIPLNPIDPVRFQTPSEDSLTNFTKVLADAGLRVMIRFSKGRDIQAACGQLVRPKRTTTPLGKNLISENLSY